MRTGTILFSVVQPMDVSEKEQMIGAARAHKEAQAKAATEAAKGLAKLVSRQVNELVAAADDAAKSERKAHMLPPPVLPQTAAAASAVTVRTP